MTNNRKRDTPVTRSSARDGNELTEMEKMVKKVSENWDKIMELKRARQVKASKAKLVKLATRIWTGKEPRQWNEEDEIAYGRVQLREAGLIEPPHDSSGELAQIDTVRRVVSEEIAKVLPLKSIAEDVHSTLSIIFWRGRDCALMIDEIRRIRFMCIDRGHTLEEVKNDHPGYRIWSIIEGLPVEDQNTFRGPNTWGPVVGYAKVVLGKHFGKSPDTITNWVKAYKASVRKQPRK